MLDQSLSQKIDRKSAQVLLKALDYFPELLAAAEPEAAAKIVADLVKSLVTRPLPEPDPGAELAEVIRRARQEVSAQ